MTRRADWKMMTTAAKPRVSSACTDSVEREEPSPSERVPLFHVYHCYSEYVTVGSNTISRSPSRIVAPWSLLMDTTRCGAVTSGGVGMSISSKGQLFG